MNILRTFFIAAMVIATAACSPTSNVPDIDKNAALGEAKIQRELAVREQYASIQRLMNVSEPLLLANADICGKLVTNYVGARYGTLDTAGKEFRAVYKSLYGIADQPTVMLLSENSPARDLLQIGDVVKRVNGKNISKGKRGAEAIRKELKKQKSSTAVFHVNRKGQDIVVNVPTRPACDSPVILMQNDAVNAVADGEAIAITTGMMRFASSDTELATIIGHELAHNSRRHVQSKKTNTVVGAVVGIAVSVAVGVDVSRVGAAIGAAAHSQGFESEADYVGLYHAARAGFDISSAPNLWRRIAASNASSIGFRKSSSHPSSAKRFLTLEATVAEIESKKAAGLPLVPEEKKANSLANQKDTS